MPPPTPIHRPEDNRLLAALPRDAFERLLPDLELTELATDAVLWEINEKSGYLYFPTTSLVALVHESEGGGSLAVATIGRSGAVGPYSGMDVTTYDRAVVVCGGLAYRMTSARADSEIARCSEFQSLVLAYTNSLLVRIAQSAVCNRTHRIEQQLAGWLLVCRDELRSDSLTVTHDQIARVLGVRRESISLAAAQLDKVRVIRNSRGKVRILKPEALAHAACECYSIILDHLDESLAKYSQMLPSRPE